MGFGRVWKPIQILLVQSKAGTKIPQSWIKSNYFYFLVWSMPHKSPRVWSLARVVNLLIFHCWLNSRFSKFTMGIWLCEWLRGQNFETAAQKIIIWKFWGNIFTVCFYFDRQMTVRIIEPQFKKEREFQKFITKIFTQLSCHCKRRKIWV